MIRSLTLAAAVVALGCGASQPPPQPVAAPVESAEPVPSGTVSAEPKPEYPPGLGVDDTKVGTGVACKKGDHITVRYVGTLDDGTEFDRNDRATFQIGVGMLIKGWDEGIPGMHVGGVRQLTIPPSLGYGTKATGKVPAYSTLHFEVELLEVNP